MNDVLSYADLFILLPSIIAIVFIIGVHPFLYYFLGRLLLERWPVRGLRLWAMSGINLKNLPFYCSFDCSISDCKNWTCPNYSKCFRR